MSGFRSHVLIFQKTTIDFPGSICIHMWSYHKINNIVNLSIVDYKLNYNF